MENAVAQKLRRVLKGRNCLRGHPIMRESRPKKKMPLQLTTWTSMSLYWEQLGRGPVRWKSKFN